MLFNKRLRLVKEGLVNSTGIELDSSALNASVLSITLHPTRPAGQHGRQNMF